MKPLIISLCDRTGIMVKPWLDDGYPCIIVDIEHPRGVTREGLLTKVGCRVEDYKMPRDFFYGIAQPPCTDLTISGAHKWEEKGPERLKAAVDFAKLCWLKISAGEKYSLENPIGRLPKYWRKYNFIFNPNEYAGYLKSAVEAYTKKTCIWCGGSFIIPKKRPVFPIKGSIITNNLTTGKRRSVAPLGWAIAVHHFNKLR